MATLRDKIWLWGQIPGGHHTSDIYHLPGENKMTPTEGLSFFGIENLCRVKLSKEADHSFWDDQWLGEPAKKLCLSLIGAGSKVPKPDMDTILSMAEEDPRIVSAVMDDFIGEARMKVFTPDVLHDFVNQLHNTLDRPLELWSVIYERDLDKPIAERAQIFDVTTFWVWYGTNLPRQQEYIDQVRSITNNGRLMLGVYMYDYGNKCPLSDELMKRQLDLVGNKLATGEIEGAILCSNCIADIGLPAVDITLDWLNQL